MASTTTNPPASASPDGPSRGMSGVMRAANIMVAATLLSRILGMLRDTVIAAHFGLSVEMDAYQAAFKVPDLLMYLIAGGALSSTFVPVFSEYWHQNKVRSAWKTFSVVTTVTFLVATLFVVVAEIWTPQFIHLLNQGYDAQRVALAVPLTRVLLPAQIFFMLGSLLMGTQNARGFFLNAALAPSVYNLGIIVGAVVLTPFMGIHGLVWGALLGAFVGNFLMQVVPVVKLGMHFRPSLAIGYPGAVKVWKLLLPIILGVSLPNVDQIINTSFASLLPVGSQSAMNYAVRVMLIPIGVFAQAMGIAILPTMSKMAAGGQHKAFKSTVNKGLRTILFLTLPASALMFLLAVPIIALLYQHGKFGPLQTYLTAVPLRFYAIGIFAWSAQAILTRAFYALQDSRTPVISGTVMTVVFIGMNWVVVNLTSWGTAGLATATTIAAILHSVVMYVLLRRRLRGLQDMRLLVACIQIAMATGALFVATFAVRTLLQAIHSMNYSAGWAAFVLSAAGAVGIAAYLGVAWLLHMPELAPMLNLAKRLTGRLRKG